MNYYVDGALMTSVNSMNLLSIDKSRKEDKVYGSDSTYFTTGEQPSLFEEAEWKGLKEEIPRGP